MKAHALSFVAPRRVELSVLELPETEPGQTVVATRYSGISAGTELLAYRGEIDPSLPLDETLGALSGTFTYPFQYGYSCVGTVERGDGQLADGTLVFAYHPHQDRFVVDGEQLIALGGLDPRVATLFPLVETALQISLDAGPVADEVVVVMGMGAVGILTAALLRRAGAQVVGAEPNQWRRETAAIFGVGAVDPTELTDVVAERTGGAGVPLVVEASGSPEVLASGLDLLAHEGTALVASWYGTKPVGLPLGGAFHRRRLTIRSTQVSTIPAALSGRWTVARRRQVVRELLDELPVAALATHEFPFWAAAEAFARLDQGEPGVLHAALSYDTAADAEGGG
jgi:2-desacetyl-2-hydroxyethyl bacteriochlorophyllide A dehydrogenase